MENCLLIEKEGMVAVLTLNRPEQFNALNAPLQSALRDAISDIEADDAIRIVILKGNGRGFCAGADLKGGLEHPVSDHIDREYKPIMMGIAESKKLWIAQVHGSAAGIGAALAINCDFITMADDATIYMAFAAISLVPDGGNTQLLIKGMGYHRALEAIVEGEKIAAEHCLKYGLVNKLFPSATLDAETYAWAKSLTERAPLAVAAAKRILRTVDRMSLDEAVTAEGLEQNALATSEDFKAGVQAFFDKKKPVFTGQ